MEAGDGGEATSERDLRAVGRLGGPSSGRDAPRFTPPEPVTGRPRRGVRCRLCRRLEVSTRSLDGRTSVATLTGVQRPVAHGLPISSGGFRAWVPGRMRMRTNIEKVIVLAETWAREVIEEDQRRQQGPHASAGVGLGDYLRPGPAKIALTEFVAALPEEQVRLVAALMYCGRGDSDDLRWMIDYLKREPVERLVDTICSKVPLASYLRTGLESVGEQVPTE